MKKLFLLDAYALIYRAYYAFISNPRRTSKGLDTGAIFGFINTLIEVIRKEKPTHLAVAFDTAEATFRHEEFEAYKAHRVIACVSLENLRKHKAFLQEKGIFLAYTGKKILSEKETADVLEEKLVLEEN